MGYMYALSWKLLTIGLLPKYFATLLKILHLKKVATKCSIFLHQLFYFLLWEGQEHFWGIRIKFHLGRKQGKGKREYGRRSPKLAVLFFFFFFCKIPIIKQVINFISQTVAIVMPKNLWAKTFKWFWAVLPGQKQLCVFLRNKYAFQIESYSMEKIKSIWPGRNAQNGLILHACSVLDVLIPMAQVLRLCTQMFVSSGLYVCITLETTHHRTTFGIFCNITQNTTPEENSHKMFHIFLPVVLFSYGKVKAILGHKD